MRSQLLFAVIICASFVAAAAFAKPVARVVRVGEKWVDASGGVRGRVTHAEKLVPVVYAELSRDAHRFAWREPSPTVRAQFRGLSANVSRDVSIAVFGRGAPLAMQTTIVRVAGGRATPATTVVQPGARIALENRDPFAHRLYVVDSNVLPPETTAANARREWSAQSAGARYEIRDELTPSFRAFVIVEEGVMRAVSPARDGSFTIPLPPGEFVIRAYFDGKSAGKSLLASVGESNLVELQDAIDLTESIQ